ncbi:MAG: DNA mismatch repair endonuclease MutL [Clostridia bacterium]|nr:DNA mismatch repair endonuclease MutL [Clostridia bacterium]
MPKINLLPKEMAELIAAGEVVERPASVVKELVENSIDAGAKHITLEIQRGGILYIRVTDDGCGIAFDDVPTAFLRHATSKIRTTADLERISSLGFRGEALAATSVVSKTEMFTKQKDDVFGTHYIIEGGEEKLYEENGCPDGTTIIVRDIFYNTPARMKFLKKDITEGNYVAAVFERIAISHPEIAFKLIKDEKIALNTSGDGKLFSAIYSVLGREIASTLISLEAGGPVSVSGYICKPAFCRKSRAVQYVFLNGRYVQSNTVMAAVEQAYKNSAMVGKYPAFILNIDIPFETVDVNVHPAKTQVRFSDEKRIFDAVYIAVKNAIVAKDTRPEIILNKKNTSFGRMSAEEYRQEVAKIPPTPAEKAYGLTKPTQKPTEKPVVNKNNESETSVVFRSDNTPFFERKDVKEYLEKTKSVDVNIKVDEKPTEIQKDLPKEPAIEKKTVDIDSAVDFSSEPKFIGEAFSTYIIAEMDDSIYLIDKHAAHERINFNRLKSEAVNESQQLLLPVNVRLGREEFDAVLQNLPLLSKAGFDIEDFGNATVLVRAVPAMLFSEDVADMVTEAAKNILLKGIPESEKLDRIYHTVACKAAIKGGNITTKAELENLAKTVLADKEIMYCPHGRPVAFKLSKREIEKQFGRIV